MTTLSHIDDGTATITRSVRIEAPRDLVWAVLTTPEQIARWFGQTADFPDGVHPGAAGSFGWADHGAFPVRIESVDPPSAFAFTWGTPGEEIGQDNSTTATFTLSEDDGGTLLTVVESGFDTLAPDAVARRAAMEDNAQGWNSELDELVAHVAALQTGSEPLADLDAGTLTHTVLVHAGIDRTWDAVTGEIGQWWGHPTTFPDGLRTGALGTWEWIGHGLFPIRVERCERPTRFGLRWGEMGGTDVPDGDALTRFTLAPAGPGATLVTVLETGLDDPDLAARRARLEDNTEGWRTALDGLATHLLTEAA